MQEEHDEKVANVEAAYLIQIEVRNAEVERGQAELKEKTAEGDDPAELDRCHQTIKQLQAELRQRRVDFQDREIALHGFDQVLKGKNDIIADQDKAALSARAESHRMRDQVERLFATICQLKDRNINLQAQIDAKASNEPSQSEASQYATELHERCMKYEKALHEAKEQIFDSEEKMLFEAMYRHGHTAHTDRNVKDWTEQRAERERQAKQSRGSWFHCDSQHPVWPPVGSPSVWPPSYHHSNAASSSKEPPVPKVAPDMVYEYQKILSRRVECNGTLHRYYGQTIQMSGESYPGQTIPNGDLPETPVFGKGPVTIKKVKRVTGWITNEAGEHIEQIEEFEVEVDPVDKEEDHTHFNRRVIMHRRLCEVAMQMHRIQEIENDLVEGMIYSMGEHQKVGLQHGNGRTFAPFRGWSGWNDRMIHTIEDILGIKEKDEPACYTEAGVNKFQRCRAYLEWHADRTATFCAGPRAEKIRQDWYQMIELARTVASAPAARERYYKYGIWTDGNVNRWGAHRLTPKTLSVYKWHPVPIDATIFEWGMVGATKWHEHLQGVQGLELVTLTRDAPELGIEFINE